VTAIGVAAPSEKRLHCVDTVVPEYSTVSLDYISSMLLSPTLQLAKQKQYRQNLNFSSFKSTFWPALKSFPLKILAYITSPVDDTLPATSNVEETVNIVQYPAPTFLIVGIRRRIRILPIHIL
jgi:predicted secreted protein